MHTIKRYILTLAAIFALTAGAWAEDYLYLVIDGTSATMKYGADKGSNPYYRFSESENYWRWFELSQMVEQEMQNQDAITTLTVDASCQNFAGTSLESLFDWWTSLATINNLKNLNTSNVTSMYRMFACCKAMTSLDLSFFDTSNVTDMHEMFNGCNNLETLDLSGWNTSNATNMSWMFYYTQKLTTIYVGDKWKTADYSTGMFSNCGTSELKEKPASPEVVIDDTKSEATFTMPAYDLNVEYTLKRDMTVDMAAQVGNGTEGVRYRVKRNAGTETFAIAGMTSDQVKALFSVEDEIEETALTQQTDYTVQIFAVDDNDQPTGTATTLDNFNFAPGRYVVKAVAAEGSNYSGTTAQSNVFQLFQGYEVQIAAGEYITYYKEEALYVEDEDVKLYTVTDVNGDKATATEISVARPYMPILVKNNSQKAKIVVLIPATDKSPDAVFVHEGFKGTLEATQIAASDNAKNNYAFNGKQFVWVKNAIDIAANKAWLEIPVSATAQARALMIVFSGDTTGVDLAPAFGEGEGEWYDLNGRKLGRKPAAKGVYILRKADNTSQTVAVE